jgi:hypothetical protein
MNTNIIASTTNQAGLSTAQKNALAIELTEFNDKTQAMLLNLSTPNSSIAELFHEAVLDPDTSFAKMSILQHFMQVRTQITETLSNLLRALNEGMRTIISNMR